MSTKAQLTEAILEIDPDFAVAGLNKTDLQAAFDSLTEEEGERGMAGTMAKYREGYLPSVSPSGRKSLNNGDKIAAILEGRDADEVLAIAEQLLRAAQQRPTQNERRQPNPFRNQARRPHNRAAGGSCALNRGGAKAPVFGSSQTDES